MAKNTNSRFTIKGNVGVNNGTTMAPTLTTAAADFTGVSANNALVFTADTTNGSRIVGLHFEAIGTNTASVARIYINNGSTNTTATNNSLVGQLTLPGTTTSNIAAVGSADFVFPGGVLDLPEAGTPWRIYVGLGTTVAAGWVVTPVLGGNY